METLIDLESNQFLISLILSNYLKKLFINTKQNDGGVNETANLF